MNQFKESMLTLITRKMSISRSRLRLKRISGKYPIHRNAVKPPVLIWRWLLSPGGMNRINHKLEIYFQKVQSAAAIIKPESWPKVAAILKHTGLVNPQAKRTQTIVYFRPRLRITRGIQTKWNCDRIIEHSVIVERKAAGYPLNPARINRSVPPLPEPVNGKAHLAFHTPVKNDICGIKNGFSNDSGPWMKVNHRLHGLAWKKSMAQRDHQKTGFIMIDPVPPAGWEKMPVNPVTEQFIHKNTGPTERITKEPSFSQLPMESIKTGDNSPPRNGPAGICEPGNSPVEISLRKNNLEIETIADQVYKILEKRLIIERSRRGIH